MAQTEPRSRHGPVAADAPATGNKPAATLPGPTQKGIQFPLRSVSWLHVLANAFPAIRMRTGLIRPRSHCTMLSFGCYLNRLLFVQRVMLVVNPSRAGQPAPFEC